MKKQLQNVMLVASSQYRGLFNGICYCLSKKSESNVYVYVATKEQEIAYRDQLADCFADIRRARALYDHLVEDGDIALLNEKAREIENQIGFSLNQFIVSDRHLGRGFALAGFHHPRSWMSRNATTHAVLNGLIAEIEYWNTQLDELMPDLVINPGKILATLAKKRNIPVRVLAGARFENFYYWAKDEFRYPAMDLRMLKTEDEHDRNDLERPYSGYTKYRALNDQKQTLTNSLKSSLWLIARQIYWRLKGYEKVRGYSLFDNLRFVRRQYTASKAMRSSRLLRLSDLEGEKFFFFPLATEPETALQLLSPEYFFQLESIAMLCRDMPAGYKLIVKEHHTALGRRPTDFYKQIEDFHCAQFVHMDETGFSLVKNSAVVVTITGTAGFEAAVMGKPVIVFGRHNLYNDLPHVFVVEDIGDLSRVVRLALSTCEESNRKAGRQFLSSLKGICFDLGEFSPWNPGEVENSVVESAYENLLCTFES